MAHEQPHIQLIHEIFFSYHINYKSTKLFFPIWVCPKVCWCRDKSFIECFTMVGYNPWMLQHCTVHEYLNDPCSFKTIWWAVFSIKTAKVLFEHGGIKQIKWHVAANSCHHSHNTIWHILLPCIFRAICIGSVTQCLPVNWKEIFQPGTPNTFALADNCPCCFPRSVSYKLILLSLRLIALKLAVPLEFIIWIFMLCEIWYSKWVKGKQTKGRWETKSNDWSYSTSTSWPSFLGLGLSQ